MNVEVHSCEKTGKRESAPIGRDDALIDRGDASRMGQQGRKHKRRIARNVLSYVPFRNKITMYDTEYEESGAEEDERKQQRHGRKK